MLSSQPSLAKDGSLGHMRPTTCSVVRAAQMCRSLCFGVKSTKRMLLALERAKACAERKSWEMLSWNWGGTYVFTHIAHVVGEHLVDYFLKG